MARRLVVSGLLDALRPPAAPGACICELGFGSGWLLEEVAAAFPGCAIYGLDQSAAMIRHVLELRGARVRLVRGAFVCA